MPKHEFKVPDHATAKGLVAKDIKEHGDGRENHDKANVGDTDLTEHVKHTAEHPVPEPKGRWIDDSWVGDDHAEEPEDD